MSIDTSKVASSNGTSAATASKPAKGAGAAKWADERLGLAGLANARLAYQAYEEVFATPRWQTLAEDGAHTQRPLWASTGVKDPSYPDTMYVTELVAADVVNTMPGKTLEATADHGDIHGDTVTGAYELAANVLDDLDGQGVSYTEVVDLLEVEGVEKFEKAWGELLSGVTDEMKKAQA